MDDHMVSFRCMLVDNNGFLVYHPDANFQYKHLIQLEPEVADSLIALGHMQQAQCKDFAWKVEYYTWKVSINTGVQTRQQFYEILEIQKTNVFLIIIDVQLENDVSQISCDSCFSGDYENDTMKCERLDGRCHCPCTSPLNYISCKNQFEEVGT